MKALTVDDIARLNALANMHGCTLSLPQPQKDNDENYPEFDIKSMQEFSFQELTGFLALKGFSYVATHDVLKVIGGPYKIDHNSLLFSGRHCA